MKISLPMMNILINVRISRGDVLNLYSTLALTNWSFLSDEDEVNMTCNLFYDIFFLIFNQYIKKSRRYPIWSLSEIIFNIKSKGCPSRNHKQAQNYYSLAQYKYLRALVKKAN